jgi:hypothetical protein
MLSRYGSDDATTIVVDDSTNIVEIVTLSIPSNNIKNRYLH